MRLEIYTDGSCYPNPGPGGWCAVILRDKKPLWELSGHERSSTNNRMELTAILEALRHLPDHSSVRVYTDSQYCQRTCSERIDRWYQMNWKKVLNRTLWMEIYEQLKRVDCEVIWVRGHNGDRWNEYCDKIAEMNRKRASTDPDPASRRLIDANIINWENTFKEMGI